MRDRRLPAPARARCAPSCASSAWCPAFGGDPDRAAVEAPRASPPVARRRRRDAARRAADAGRRPVAVAPGRSALGPPSPASTAGPTRRSSGSAATRSPTPCSRTATELGDFSLIWHIVNVARGPHRRPPAPTRCRCSRSPSAPRACSSTRASSACSAGPARPSRATPATRCAARDVVVPVRARQRGGVHGRRCSPGGTAGARRRCGGRSPSIVATSRAYVRIHHASDVVAGMATGAVLGLGARRDPAPVGNRAAAAMR